MSPNTRNGPVIDCVRRRSTGESVPFVRQSPFEPQFLYVPKFCVKNKMAFYASCAECGFEANVETVNEVLDRQVNHRREYDANHVLEFEAKQAQ